MIYNITPEQFNPQFEVVSCYVEHNGEILLLHRCNHKSEGDRWGVPAGKIDLGENESQAMLREIQEETGYKIDSNKLEYLKKVYVKYSDYDFIYHMFKTQVDERLEVVLSTNEHKGYKWISPTKALELNLVRDLDKCIKMYY